MDSCGCSVERSGSLEQYPHTYNAGISAFVDAKLQSLSQNFRHQTWRADWCVRHRDSSRCFARDSRKLQASVETSRSLVSTRHARVHNAIWFSLKTFYSTYVFKLCFAGTPSDPPTLPQVDSAG